MTTSPHTFPMRVLAVPTLVAALAAAPIPSGEPLASADFTAGAAFIWARGPTLRVLVVTAADGSGADDFLIDAQTPNTQVTATTIPGGIRQIFRSQLQSNTLGSFSLRAELDLVSLGPTGGWDLSGRVTEIPSHLAVTEIGFQVEPVDVDGEQALVTPTFSGGVFLEPAKTIPVNRPLDTGVANSMQVTAFYADDGGGWVMFAADPGGVEPKHFQFTTRKTQPVTTVALSYYLADGQLGGRPVSTPVVTRLLPYVFDPQLEAGWYRAAKLYRAWLVDNATGPGGILEQGRLETRVDVPRWMKETDLLDSEQFGWSPVSVYPRAASESASFVEVPPVPRAYEFPLDHLRRLRTDLGVTNMLVGLWFWYDRGKTPLGRIGTYLAPASLATQLHALKSSGIRCIAYVHPGAFDVLNPMLTAAGLADDTVQARDGTTRTFTLGVDYSGVEVTAAIMDVASPELANWFQALGAFHSEYTGLSGFYCDLPVTVGYEDWIRPVGSSLGLTKSAYRGFQNILRASRVGAAVFGHDFVHNHEGAFEWLINTAAAGQGAVGVIGRAYPDETRAFGVPFFQTVYSGYTLFWPADEGHGPQTLKFVDDPYGNPDDCNMSRILAEGVTWGMMPSSSEIDLENGKLFYESDRFPRYAAAFQHHKRTLTNLIALRRRARKWLVFGEMLQSPVAGGDTADLTIKLRFAGEPTPRLQTFSKPLVPTTAWRAADATIRLIAANGSKQPAKVVLSLQRIGLPAGQVLVDTDTNETFSPRAGTQQIEVPVAPATGRILEPR